jgi:ketosteroid isomerase-like protein
MSLLTKEPEILFIREVFEPWAQGDFSRIDMFDDEVEFVTPAPEQRIYHGHEGAGQAWGDFLGAWKGFTVEADDVLPAGNDRYVVLVHLRGRGHESGVPIEARAANLVTLRNGRIIRFELFFKREEALAAAGLETGG